MSRPDSKKKATKKAAPEKKSASEKKAPSVAGAARGFWMRVLAVAGLGGLLAGLALYAGAGCSGWDPRSPFERRSPEVDQAMKDLDAGELLSAEEALEKYLGTGACSGDGGIGLPDSVRQKPNGSFDLGLTLFYLGEHYGHRFGDEESSDGGDEDPAEQKLAAQRSAEIDCALVIVKAIASDPKVPAELRARAYYLAGNLEFLRKKYEDAVKYYDQALGIVPGLYEEAGGDAIGRDAAWNRAIALRRNEDQKDAGSDAADGSDGSDGEDGADGADSSDGESGNDGGDAGDAGEDGGKDGGEPDSGKGDAGGEDGGKDGGSDAGDQDAAAPPPEPQKKQEPVPVQQDERMLDQLEEAPTYQEQEAKARAGVRRGRAMEDK